MTWAAGTWEWFNAAAALTRRAMLAGGRYHRRSCVDGSAIGADVLRYFGVSVRGLAVRCLAITPDALAWNSEHGWDSRAPVGHSVGIGYAGMAGQATAAGDWDGHLVLYAPRHRNLVDLTIDQADRPEHGLHLPGPVVIGDLDDAWPGNGQPLTIEQSGGAVVLRYEPMTGREAVMWGQFAGWRASGFVRRQVVGEAIRAVRGITA